MIEKLQKSSFNWGWKVAVHQFKSLCGLGLVWMVLISVFLSNLHLSNIRPIPFQPITYLLPMGQGSWKSWFGTHQPSSTHPRLRSPAELYTLHPQRMQWASEVAVSPPNSDGWVMEAEAPGVGWDTSLNFSGVSWQKLQTPSVDVGWTKNDLHFYLTWYTCWIWEPS